MPLLILLGLLAIADVLTTVRALRRPGLHEANGVVAWLMRRGPVWIVVKLAITAFGGWALRDQPLLLSLVCGRRGAARPDAGLCYSNQEATDG